MNALRLASIIIALLVIDNRAIAQTFTPCQPSNFQLNEAAKKVDDERCKAIDALLKDWSDTVDTVASLRDEANFAASAGNWDAFRTILAKAKPLFTKIKQTSEENKNVDGAPNLIHQLGDGLIYIFKNVRLKEPRSLDEAFAELDRAANVQDEQNAAATVFSVMSGNMRWNMLTLVGGLRAKIDTNFGKLIANANADDGGLKGWLYGFGDRLGRITGMLTYPLLTGLYALVQVGRGKRDGVWAIKITSVVLVVSVALWAVYVIVPFLVPILGAVALGLVLCLGGPVRLFWGWPGKPPLVKLEQQPALLALVIGTAVCMGVAFSLPSWLGAISACLLVWWAAEHGFAGAGVARFWSFRVPAPGATRIGTDSLKISGDPLHGSARWGTQAAAQGAHHVGPRSDAGFLLGHLAGAPFLHTGHVLTCAPTGAGKGIGAVIPNLLTYPGSALVLDIKGENAAVTARRRREQGHSVFVVNPFGVLGLPSHAYNWLDRINVDSPDCVGEAAALAECLVVPSGGENVHFDDTARGLIQGMLLYVAGLPDRSRRHIGELRRLLTLDTEEFREVMVDMAFDPNAIYGIPARSANSIMSIGDKERGSILSTARRNTAFLDDPRILSSVIQSEFSFSDMKTGLTTVYIVIPPDKLSPNKQFVRGLIGSALSAMTADGKKPKNNVAFMLDEFGQLGRMNLIEDAISLVRGYGVSFWIFVQDISQLKGVYPKWQTFTANTAKQFFGTADFDTAKYISDSIGKATVVYKTEGTSRKLIDVTGVSKSSNEHLMGRSLLTPDEVMRLGPAKPIIMISGEPPYMLDRVNYLDDPSFAGQFDPNPYHG